MKRLLLALMLSVSISTYAQSKGASRIIISSNLTAEENYRKILNHLLDKRVDIDKRDDMLFMVKTSSRQTSRGIRYALQFRAVENKIYLWGSFMVPELGKDYDPIVYRGMKGSGFMVAWDEMNAIAKTISSDLKYD